MVQRRTLIIPSHSSNSILVICSHPPLGQSKCSPSFTFPTETSMHFSAPPYVPHALPISSSVSFCHEAGSSNYEAPHYVVFSTRCYLVPLSSKYLPEHLILEHPQPMFLPEPADQVSSFCSSKVTFFNSNDVFCQRLTVSANSLTLKSPGTGDRVVW
jgi:hypothetical protein